MEIKNKKEYIAPHLISLGQMKIITQGGSSHCTDNTNTKVHNPGNDC